MCFPTGHRRKSRNLGETFFVWLCKYSIDLSPFSSSFFSALLALAFCLWIFSVSLWASASSFCALAICRGRIQLKNFGLSFGLKRSLSLGAWEKELKIWIFRHVSESKSNLNLFLNLSHAKIAWVLSWDSSHREKSLKLGYLDMSQDQNQIFSHFWRQNLGQNFSIESSPSFLASNISALSCLLRLSSMSWTLPSLSSSWGAIQLNWISIGSSIEFSKVLYRQLHQKIYWKPYSRY